MDPDVFEPDLSTDIMDGTIQADLYWCNLPPHQQPPATLLFRHFNTFLLNELHILNQQDAHLLHLHNQVLGTKDHTQQCTLEWVHWQFARKIPNPNITINTLTDPERDKFNYLLNWAHAVYTIRVSYYNDRWTYAQGHHAATPWLDHAIITDTDPSQSI